MRALPAAVALLAACGGARVDLGWRLPEDGTLVVSEERSTITRTPLGLEEIVVTGASVWRVVQHGRVGVDEVSWDEEVTAWSVTWRVVGDELSWTLGQEEPLPERLAHLAPPPPRRVWVRPDGEMSVQVAPEAANAETEAPSRRPLTRVPPWVAGLARAPREPVPQGRSWSWTHSTSVTPATQASATVTWTYKGQAGPQAILEERLDLAGSPPPASGAFQTTALAGSGELRLDTRTGFPVSFREDFDADIASPSARGTAVRRSRVSFEVH